MKAVLVVDDDPIIREVLREYIEGEGHRVLEACDATSARRVLAQESVDLVFLDVLMPGESGSALCRSIKEDPESRDTKVVLMTGSDGESAWREGFRSGADIFAVKPVNRERIRVLLEELIGASGGGT